MLTEHRQLSRLLAVAVSTIALVLSTVPPAVPAVLGGATDQMLRRESPEVPAPVSPDGLLEGLQSADPAEGLAAVEPPEATADGGAHLSYPLVVPDGRGITPDVSLDYESGAPSTWVGQGWNITMGEVSVDTTFGVPLFCPRQDVAPTCGDYESETYRLDGDLLAPTAVRTDLQPRVAERADFTRKVETEYEHIIRHGDSPENYYWEVRDKQGNISWYGGNPDAGGPFGGPGTRTGAAANDAGRAPSAILSDDRGNAVRWYLKAQRDVGVNLIRYEYDTVHYRATAGADGVVWTESTADCTGVCGRHVYLSKIYYTGAAEESGQDEAPSYEISLVRGSRRSDPVVDARGGFIDVDLEQLTRVEVRYLKSGSDETARVVRYDLETEVGEFGKTMLTAVHQTGCATGTSCSPGTRATHTFDYYDEVESGSGFAPPVVWDTRDDGIDSPFLDGEVGALGMSETDGGDGHVYVGFNPLTPLKNGSFGGSVSFEGSKTRSKVEFLDINGDQLPDKVFVDDTGVHYRLNTSKPGDPLDRAITFRGGDAGDVTGLDRLPGESQFGITGGVEAFFGVSAMFNAGGSWNWSEGYFADVNGDGLPDWVNNGQVLFNHLECEGGGDDCRPVFDESSTHTRMPLSIRPVDGAADDALAEVLAMLRRLSPPIDTLRRWTAPYDGVVTIEADASFPPVTGNPGSCAQSGDGVRLAIQHNDTEIASCVLDGPNQHWPVTVPGFPVAKGDRLYFRVGPDVDEPSSTVEWHPTVSYTSFTSGPAPAQVPADENGLDQTTWSSAADFTLAGRPNAYVGMPEGGTLGYTGVLQKAVTTDQVRPTIRHFRGSAPNALVDEPVTVTALAADLTADPARQKQVVQDGSRWCVQYPDGTRFACLDTQAQAQQHLQVLFPAETGLFGIAARFDVDAPVLDGNGAQTAQDRVELKLQVDSPVRVTALSWKRAPEMCYLAGTSCKDGSPRLDPPVDTDVYTLHSNVAPREAWTAPADGVRRVRVGFSVVGNIFDGHPAATAWVTVKGTDGSLARHPVAVPADAFGDFQDAGLEVTVKQGVGYWFDVTVREPAVFHLMRNGKVEVSTGTDAQGNTTWAEVTNPHSAFNGTGWQGYFALPWRGWAMAGYRADGDRRHQAVVEADLTIPPAEDADAACQALTGGPCQTSNEGADFPDAYGDDYGPGGPGFDEESTQAQIRKAYAFLPQRTLAASREVTEQVWTGPKQTMRGTATHVSASRLGEVIPGAPPAGGSVAPPTLKGQVAPSLAVTAGVGPLTGSFGVGWSKGDVDFLDMNGDQFPDVVRDGSIEFTDPRGGHACLQPGGGLAACSGGGVGALAEEFSLTAGGGLSGSPVKLDGNAKGRTNSTQGSQAGRGGQVSKDDYGDGLGAGLNVAASFTSPVVGTPAWDDQPAGGAGFDPGDFDDIPGDPVGSSGLQLQRSIADVNGDGLPDQVRTTTDGVFVKLNLGYAFAPAFVPWAPGSGFESGESYSGAAEVGIGFGGFFKDFSGGVSRNVAVDFPRYSWADVNGDGVLDALRKGSDDVRVGFGNGTGIRKGQVYGAAGAVPVSALPGLEVPLGDQIRQQSALGWGGGFDFTISIGPLCVAACYLIVNPGAHFQKGQSLTDVEMLDVNGDGFADSVTRHAEGGHEELLEVRLNEQGRTGLLRSVHNPLGGSFTLDYERRGNTVEHPEPLWVMSRVKADDGRPGDGVDVQTTKHEYGEPRFDFEHREHLGFDSVTTRELAPGGAVLRTTRGTYANRTLWESGLEQRTEVFDGNLDGTRLSRTTRTWEVLDGESQDPLDAPTLSTDDRLKAWATPLLQKVREESFEHGVGRATETSYEYDRLGNATGVTDHGDLDDPADDVIAEVEFSTCENAASAELAELCGSAAGPSTHQPAYWDDQLCPTWTSLPAVLTVRDAAGTVLRHRDGRQDLCDNSSVTLLRELIDGTPADGTFAETILAYDDWGSYDRIVYPPGGNGRRYAVHYEYDPERHSDVAEVQEYDLVESEVGTFMDFEDPFGTPFAPAVEPASKGLTSTATFNGRAGQLASSTDPNGSTTAYEYDALSRLSRVTMPDGGAAWFDYAPTASYAHAVAHHSDEAHPGDPIDSVTFVDGFARVTQQKQETDVFRGVGQAPEHGFTVSGHLRFDALGRVVEEAHPTFEPAGSATAFAPAVPDTPSTLTTWDKLDRPRSATLPGERTTTIDYRLAVGLGTSLLEQDVTDPLGRRTVTSSDVRGHVRAVDDIAVGKAPLRTTYTLDRLGQLLEVGQAGREQVRHTWDLLGRRTSTDTEDGGLTTYGYDAFGRRVSEQTAVQRAAGDTRTTYHFDFDKLVGVDFPDDTPDVSYAWGGYLGAPTADNGAGRIVRIEDAARKQTLGYDENGLLASETTEMVGDDWKLGELTTTWDLDWLGRTLTLGYPDGETLRHGYDRGGTLDKVTGSKSCTDVGRLTAPVDAVQTQITVSEFPHEAPPTLPFTITIDREQMLVTDRVATPAAGVFTYTVVRGTNGTAEAPTAATHDAGAVVRTDAELTCSYRYLDRLEYDHFGAPAFRQVGNGNRTSYTPDPLTRRLARQVTVSPQQGGREQQDLNYTYDKVGNVRTYVNDVPADVPSLFGGKVSQTYTYDGYYRLTSARGTWQEALNTRRFEYDVTLDDATGNTTAKHQKVWEVKVGCKKNCIDVIEDNTYDFNDVAFDPEHQHRLAVQGGEQFSHDANGNVTDISSPDNLREMEWNAENKLTMVVDRPNGSGGKPTFLTYDHNGELAKEDKEQGRSWFVNPWVTVKDSTVWKNYFADDHRLGVKFSQDGFEQKVFFLHEDLLGGTHIATDRVGGIFQHQEYLPTGEPWVDEDSTVYRTPYQFSGEYTDEDHDLVDFGQRWFEPRGGIFYSADPFLYADPLALVDDTSYTSSYVLGGGNAVSNVDPDGWSHHNASAKKSKAKAAMVPVGIAASKIQKKSTKAKKPKVAVLTVNPAAAQHVTLKPGFAPKANRGGVPGSRAGKDFTAAGKQEVIMRAAAAAVGGIPRCVLCNVQVTVSLKSQSGVTPLPTEVQVDHVFPSSKGGSGTVDNGQVLCRACNRAKSNK